MTTPTPRAQEITTQAPAGTPKVYSYRRWSTKEQESGDSERRQLDAAREYAAAKGMIVDEELRDDGKSAFYGKNILQGPRAGALGRFLEHIALGGIVPGSVLVLENLDRMSRQAPHLAIGVLTEIIEAGVSVHTTNDGNTYTREAMRGQHGFTSLLGALIAFNTAHQESEKKRRRLKSVWDEKRKQAAGRPMTAKGPAWLTLNRATGEWVVIEERADVVRHIYREAIAGKGAEKIARELNEAGVATFERGRSTAKMWARSYVARLLDSPTVTGTMVPKVLVYDDNGRQRRVEQREQAVAGYYPAIVDADLVAQVRALRDSAPSPLRGKAAVTESRNIFGALLRCARCGGAMHRRPKRDRKHGTLYEYVGCRTALNGAGCKYELIRYQLVEDAFRRQAGEIITSIPLGDGGEALRDALATLDARTEALTYAAKDLRERLAENFSRTLSDDLAQLARERDAAEAEREELRKQAASAAGPFLTHRLSELSAVLDAEPLDRAAANALLRTLADAATFDLDSGFLSIAWKAGGVSEVPVLPQAFGFDRETTTQRKRRKTRAGAKR